MLCERERSAARIACQRRIPLVVGNHFGLHDKRTNTRLKNEYPDKRTISKDRATVYRSFGGRKSVGCSKSLIAFLLKKL